MDGSATGMRQGLRRFETTSPRILPVLARNGGSGDGGRAAGRRRRAAGFAGGGCEPGTARQRNDERCRRRRVPSRQCDRARQQRVAIAPMLGRGGDRVGLVQQGTFGGAHAGVTMPVVNERHGEVDPALRSCSRRRDMRMQQRRQHLRDGERQHAARESAAAKAAQAMKKMLQHADGPARIRR